MKLADLKSPKTQRVCVACKAFVAECMAPVGEGSAPMCWLCAHQVVDHEVPLHEASTAECECTPDQVYPVRVLKQRTAELEKCKLRGFQPMRELINDYMARVKDTGPSESKTGPINARRAR